MNKLEEQIEEILFRFLTQKSTREDGVVEIDVKTYVEDLSTLIQQERREAVEGYAKFINGGDEEWVETFDRENIEEYLNSIGSAKAHGFIEVDEPKKYIKSDETPNHAKNVVSTPSSISSIKKGKK